MMNTPFNTTDMEVTTKKELDRKMIKSLAGNYRVNFQFAETFAPDKNYQYHDRHYSSAKEVVLPLEETENRISLQHILSAGKHLIKHWRQDWCYENQEIWELVQGHEWKKQEIPAGKARGTWTQKVYQVDDSPRYEGYGTWVHVDGRHFWESDARAALPRREIKTAGRTDYNILKRGSHIEVFEDGRWILEQDNEKIKRHPDGNETLICMEKGLETLTPKGYDPKAIHQFWDDQKSFWADVRAIWESIRQNRTSIKVENDQALYEKQFGLARQFSGDQYDCEKAQYAIKDLLSKHVKKE